MVETAPGEQKTSYNKESVYTCSMQGKLAVRHEGVSLAWQSQLASVLRRMFAGSFRKAAVLLFSSSMTRLSAETSG